MIRVTELKLVYVQQKKNEKKDYQEKKIKQLTKKYGRIIRYFSKTILNPSKSVLSHHGSMVK